MAASAASMAGPLQMVRERVLGEMGVAGRRLNLRVAQQLADHRQALAEGQRGRGEAVT